MSHSADVPAAVHAPVPVTHSPQGPAQLAVLQQKPPRHTPVLHAALTEQLVPGPCGATHLPPVQTDGEAHSLAVVQLVGHVVLLALQ